MVTRTEASRVPELPVTWHEYSPESAGDTRFSLSTWPWTCTEGREWEKRLGSLQTSHPGLHKTLPYAIEFRK